jgi:hypothetical protein
MKKLTGKTYQRIFFVCGMKLTIVHGKQKERRMMMGVMMKMDVVDCGRELRMGASVFLE